MRSVPNEESTELSGQAQVSGDAIKATDMISFPSTQFPHKPLDLVCPLSRKISVRVAIVSLIYSHSPTIVHPASSSYCIFCLVHLLLYFCVLFLVGKKRKIYLSPHPTLLLIEVLFVSKTLQFRGAS